MKELKLYFSIFALVLSIAPSQAQEVLKLVNDLNAYVASAEGEFGTIDTARKKQLKDLALILAESSPAKATFICTHNSRRSHLAQIWAQVGAEFYGLANFESYSGGTEATAFNPRAIKALQRAGFNIKSKGKQNPLYRVYYSAEKPPLKCYSKKYDNPNNPQSGFIAVMVCSDADKACPLVDGASARVAIPYLDPKVSDGTFLEEQTYDERCRQIAIEMLYTMAQAATLASQDK